MAETIFTFGEHEHIALQMRPPEPSTHPDPRMHWTLADLRFLCPRTSIEPAAIVGERLSDVGGERAP